MKKAIAIAGTVLVDKINEIAVYPNVGELTKIQSVKLSLGGCVPNVAIDLMLLDPTLTVKAVGKLGKDSEGALIQKTLRDNGVDTSGLCTCDIPTGFTEVMSIVGGQRTFFTYAGACADFGANDIDWSMLDAEMLHLGYFLLLDKIDSGEGELVLKEAKARGLRTSIDLISESSERYRAVLPCLPYTDNVIINELEAGKLAELEVSTDTLPAIAEKLFSLGVRERVIIHTPSHSLCYSQNGITMLPSYDIPAQHIKGTTGAGDAFCAGALLGIYRGLSDCEILELATLSATAALTEADATSGMRTEKEIRKQCKELRRRTICS